MTRILIVEDNRELAEILQGHVQQLGYDVDLAADGQRGFELIQAGNYELVLLDLMLPKLDGLEVCKKVRRRDQRIPIIIITSRSEEDDVIEALESGADEYLTKPVNPLELKARINVVLRRVREQGENEQAAPIVVDDLEVDLGKRRVTKAGSELKFTAREFDLLAYLVLNAGKPIARDELNSVVYGKEIAGYEKNLSVHISRIRAKIEPDPSRPRYLLTKHGVGYVFCEISGE